MGPVVGATDGSAIMGDGGAAAGAQLRLQTMRARTSRLAAKLAFPAALQAQLFWRTLFWPSSPFIALNLLRGDPRRFESPGP